MRRRAAVLLFIPLALGAQQTVAPTAETPGSARGENASGYNIVNSFELGYRFRSVDGNLGKYRSDVNYGNGIRLLASSLSIHSQEGHGGLFDELLLNTQGLGNDPYQFSSFRIQKNRLYRYDLIWREDDYYNPALTVSSGFHLIDTVRRLQDHSVVLFPQSRFKLLAGYSRNVQTGPALTTENFLASIGADFPLLSNVRRTDDEYRLGGEAAIAGLKVALTHAWEFFRDDTRESAIPGGFIQPGTSLDTYRRDQPRHGSTGHWRLFLATNQNKRWGINGRVAYAGGRQDFVFDEASNATLRPGVAVARQTLIFGNARRPVLAANLTATLFATDKLTIVNHTSFHHTRMDGDSTIRELAQGGGFTQIDFDFLGIRTETNTTNLDYRFNSKIGIYSGYNIAARRIRSIQRVGSEEVQQSNTLHSGIFGLRLHPVKPLSIDIEGELGRANRPFYPISEKNYHVLGGRVQYRTRTVQLSAAARANYNTNSVSLSNYSSRTRNYFADASWSPGGWWGFDASYSKLHVDTLSGIAYFALGSLLNDHSYYVSNIHSGTLGAHFNLRDRASLFLGYTRVQDTGGARRVQTQLPVFFDAQVFPLTFESPLARLSIRLHQRLRWNAGYQFYRYGEDLRNVQNYHANTGFTSVSWSF